VRQLTLLRHGRAEWPASRYADFDRPLDPKGIAQVEHSAAQIAALPHRPTLCLASDAARTRETAQILARALQLPAKAVLFDHRLYLATPEVIRQVLEEHAARRPHVVLVGHNPGLSDLAGELAGKPGSVGLGTGQWRQCRLGPHEP
jgi:phosphohistidine phosphatase